VTIWTIAGAYIVQEYQYRELWKAVRCCRHQHPLLNELADYINLTVSQEHWRHKVWSVLELEFDSKIQLEWVRK